MHHRGYGLRDQIRHLKLPDGQKQERLRAAFDSVLQDDLRLRVYPFDEGVARKAAEVAAALEAQGRPIDFRDLQIAAIAAVGGHKLATRNIRHFEFTGIELIDPWRA